MEFSRQEYWNGLLFPSPGDLFNPGIEPKSPALQVNSLPSEPPRKPKNTGVGSLSLFQGIFLIKELNRGLLNCRRILHLLSYPGNPLTLFYNMLIIWSLLLFFFSFLSLPFFPPFPLQRWYKGVFSDVCKLSLKAGLHQHLCPPFELMLSSVHVTCPFIRIGISHTHSQTLSKV